MSYLAYLKGILALYTSLLLSLCAISRATVFLLVFDWYFLSPHQFFSSIH